MVFCLYFDDILVAENALVISPGITLNFALYALAQFEAYEVVYFLWFLSNGVRRSPC